MTATVGSSATATLRRGYAESPFGQLHYVEQGDGPVVLLLHQTPRSWDEFRELIPLLAGRHRVIAMDMLGFGASAPEGRVQSITGMASAAFALLDDLGIDRVSIVGHHTGAVVAIEMAAEEPGRVDALVLSSTPWTDEHYRVSHADGPGVDEAERSEDASHLVRLWELRRPYYPAPAAGLLDRFVRDALAPGVDPAEGHRACARYRMEDRIGLVCGPVLLLGASDDPFALPDVEPLRAHLTSAQVAGVVVLEGGTIPLMEQLAPEVAAVILPFLEATAS